MNASGIFGLLPLLLVAADSFLVLLAAAFIRRFSISFVLAILGLAAGLVSLGFVWPLAPYGAGSLLSFDRYVLFAVGLIYAGTLFAAISSWAYLRGRGEERGEYFFLLLLSSVGACVLAAASSFASFFLGLELLSVGLYALVAWRKERPSGTEAAIKYLVLAGASSAFLFFGMALAYAASGSMEISALASAISRDLLAAMGLGMMVVGIGFKLAVAPFHFWTPDVYDGAPAPVSGYIATISKGAMAVFLARLFAPAIGDLAGTGAFFWIFALIAGVSMFVGNLLALREDNVKRILAFSSIAHLGYLLVAFLAGGGQGLRAVAFTLVAYFATTLGAFAVVSALSTPERDADGIEDFRGLARRRPWMAGAFTASLLSLAGLPLTAGFVGKFVILRAGGGARLWEPPW
jgi:NADH-quinone oxidoreductase subunit N